MKKLPGNKVRVSARVANIAFEEVQARGWKINPTVNQALEEFYDQYDHSTKLTQQQMRTPIRSAASAYQNKGTRPTQLRIDRLYYERMMMEQQTRNYIINIALLQHLKRTRL